MDTRTAATILGTVAATSTTVAFVPQITKIWKTGGTDVSYLMLWLYVGGVTLWLGYGVLIGATALSLANAASIVFAGTCLLLKVLKAREMSGSSEGERVRIAIDMDETIADSLKEHIRRYNAAFVESIAPAELHGKHIEDLASAERTEAMRRLLREGAFFDCLDLITDAEAVLRELAREYDLFIVSSAMEIPESFTAKYRWLQTCRSFPPATLFSAGTRESLTRTTLSMMRRDISATFAALAFSFLRLTIWTKGSATVSQIGKRFEESF